uniref:Uncharacterized protein n=3 Tax=Enterococcus TaxID=1350 RepID=A0A0E3MUH4_ENTFL|nr:Hypothetical protein [Enterococcus faecalis]AWH58936.1 hypothetical protein [Enterococcus faecalis]AWH58978.1 hypothetical protein [Enterococcus faecalis]AWH59112.1 hypothetical protein [Enterococcus faecalis]QHU25747.1 Hypothetical protein [Enterococcus faecalis]
MKHETGKNQNKGNVRPSVIRLGIFCLYLLHRMILSVFRLIEWGIRCEMVLVEWYVKIREVTRVYMNQCYERRENLDLKLTSHDYQKRLDRIDIGNSVEQALYYPIQLLLESILDDRFWVTDTSLRSRKDVGNFKSVPDLMIFDENHGINTDKLTNSVAVLEIKYFPWKPENRLDTNQNQAESYLEKTNKVIYTNGIEWRFISKEKDMETICLGNDNNIPDSYYEVIDRNKLESQIHWKKEQKFNEAWEDLKDKIKDFI